MRPSLTFYFILFGAFIIPLIGLYILLMPKSTREASGEK